MKRHFTVLVSLLFVFCLLLPVSSKAASDPSFRVKAEDLFLTVPSGSQVTIHCYYFPAYKNERTHFEVYDPSGNLIASKVTDHFNYGLSSMLQYINYNLDTTNWKPGKYTIKTYCDFYTYFDWHTVAFPSTTWITITTSIWISN